MYSRVITHTHTNLFFFRFFSTIVYYKILKIVPCAIQWDLVGYLFLYIDVCIC